MHTKLTLRLSEPLIKAAKKYSKKHGKSLSQLVADYLLLVTQGGVEITYFEKIPPITLSLQGILKNKKAKEEDYKKYLEDKYL